MFEQEKWTQCNENRSGKPMQIWKVTLLGDYVVSGIWRLREGMQTDYQDIINFHSGKFQTTECLRFTVSILYLAKYLFSYDIAFDN